MKKYLKYILLFIFIFVLVGCETEKQFTVTYVFGDNINVETYEVEKGNTINLPQDTYEGYDILGFYLDKDYKNTLDNNYSVNKNITIYVKIELEKYDVIFYNEDNIYEQYKVEYKSKVTAPTNLQKENYVLAGWCTDPNIEKLFDFDTAIDKNISLYAVWKMKEFQITYNYGHELYDTKHDLYVAFFTDFYNFMLENTDVDFSQFNITTVEEFLEFSLDWNANGRDSFYGVGDAFSKYYVTIDIGGTLENQPTSTFIGYCYHNNKYLDFIPFLMRFFAYWRTDEGYTGGRDDPNNLGNDFFASAWASLVDTCKFFYFTSVNLNDTYPWFRSERVKNALDNVPTVLSYDLIKEGYYPEVIRLKNIEREGYIFLGWFDSLEENANQIFTVDETTTVYAKWEKVGE